MVTFVRPAVPNLSNRADKTRWLLVSHCAPALVACLVVEGGSHAALMACNAVHADMWGRQQEAAEEVEREAGEPPSLRAEWHRASAQ